MSERRLAAGDKAPAFALQTAEGQTVRLADFKGQRVVLYFYPKDDTPGCTKEACAFRDTLSAFTQAGVVVLGISADTPASHARFRDKFQLTFPLLSDPGAKVAEAYGVWKQKLLYGRSFLGIERTTFLIDEQGRIAHVFSKVKVDGHVDEVLTALGVSARA